MKLFYFKYPLERFPEGLNNFGDDLNPWLWQQLIPDLLDDDETTAFVGIGTLLNDFLPERVPKARRLVIFSTGVGYYKTLPKVEDSWNIYCLRGPLSAKALGVSSQLVVTDGAVLVRRLFNPNHQKVHRFSYMPHAKSARDGDNIWNLICKNINFGYIDPRWSREKILSAISQTEILLTEAMHGAIVADALRVPWIPIRTNTSILAFKWQDWCLSVGLNYQPQYVVLPRELHPMPLRARLSMPYRNHWLNWLRQDKLRSLNPFWGDSHQSIAAQLVRIAKTSRPLLSNESQLEQLTVKLEERLEKLRANVALGCFLD